MISKVQGINPIQRFSQYTISSQVCCQVSHRRLQTISLELLKFNKGLGSENRVLENPMMYHFQSPHFMDIVLSIVRISSRIYSLVLAIWGIL